MREHGGTDFGFSFGDAARFRVSVFKQKGHIGIVLRQIPSKLLTLEEIGLPPQIKDLLFKPRGLILVTGPDGLGQDDDAGQHAQRHQRGARLPHHHDRGPDRVLPRAQEAAS